MIIGGLAVGFMFYKYEHDITFQNLSGHARFTADIVLTSLRRVMLDAKPSELQATIESFTRASDIKAITIYTPEGQPAYATDSSHREDKQAMKKMVAQTIARQKPQITVSRASDGSTALNHFNLIENSKPCYSSACHVHTEENRYLGVLYTRISSATIEGASRQMLILTMALWLFFIITISILMFFINYLLVTRPIAILEKGMRRLADGSFDEPIEIKTSDEMGRLARNFNSMAHDILRYKNKLEHWAKELEAEVEKKTAEITEAQDQLVNAEKLASLGRLAAGVAHEINNPLTGIVTFAHLMRSRTPQDNTDDIEDLDLIIEQADRCTRIVKGLLGFSRKGTSEKTLCNLNGLIENSYSIIRNQSAFLDIQVILRLMEQPASILVDPNQIQQVILNLFTNAADAMNGVGQITIKTAPLNEDGNEYVEMSFSDTGPGILPEHMSKILEPFFTTKSVGKGTGLGLPVSYGIIKRHGGDLHVQSKVGAGTTFFVKLPIAADNPSSGTQETSK